MPKLNGWHRLFIVAAIIWSCAVAAYWFTSLPNVQANYWQSRPPYVKNAYTTCLEGGPIVALGLDTDYKFPILSCEEGERQYDLIKCLATKQKRQDICLDQENMRQATARDELENVEISHLQFSIMLAIAVVLIVYCLGWSIFWIRKGFGERL